MLVQTQAATLDLAKAEPAWGAVAEDEIQKLARDVLELEYTAHSAWSACRRRADEPGRARRYAARHGRCLAWAEAGSRCDRGPAARCAARGSGPARRALDRGARCRSFPQAQEIDACSRRITRLARSSRRSTAASSSPRRAGISAHARSAADRPEPTCFDPFPHPQRLSPCRMARRQAERLITRHVASGHPYPQSLAIVLWGADNVKSEGGPIGQALAMMGVATAL